MTNLSSEGEQSILPEHVFARNRAILAIRTTKDSLSIGQNSEVFDPVIQHLGGILAHGTYVPTGAEGVAFSLQNPDGSFDFVTLQPDSDRGDFVRWFHLVSPHTEYTWRGFQMRISSEFREDGSYGVGIADVITSNPNWIPKAKDDVDVKRIVNVWSFEADGSINDERSDALDVTQTPIGSFMPPPIDFTAQ